ncbi:type VII secretion target [Saccharopolyspora pogona]|uniref:type VII secretion target n=1 Tax=Saccharopolyspora pogona TaxID=333966 RepID=UPI001684F377|nr:type VII secretion target [Saccharopolyspora pogona]
MSGAQTSGSDVGKAANAFSDGSGAIKEQAKAATDTKLTAEKFGKKFHEAGKAYKDALDKLGKNIESFAEYGSKLSESFSESAKEYQARDESGAQEVGKVQA